MIPASLLDCVTYPTVPATMKRGIAIGGAPGQGFDDEYRESAGHGAPLTLELGVEAPLREGQQEERDASAKENAPNPSTPSTRAATRISANVATLPTTSATTDTATFRPIRWS